MGRFLIYGLVDPQSGELRYIGKSATGLIRPKQHTKPRLLKHRSRKNSWIKGLLALGLKPEIVVLEEYPTSAPLNDAECFWIASIKASGALLTNMTDGGDGVSGRTQSPEERALRTASLRARGSNGLWGYKQTQAHVERRAAQLRGRPKPPRTLEHRRHQALAHGAQPFTDASGRIYVAISEAVEATGFSDWQVRASLKHYSRSRQFRYVETASKAAG